MPWDVEKIFVLWFLHLQTEDKGNCLWDLLRLEGKTLRNYYIICNQYKTEFYYNCILKDAPLGLKASVTEEEKVHVSYPQLTFNYIQV